MDATGHKIGFVFSAAFIGPIYFLYRKMWGLGILAALLNLLLNLPTALMMMAEMGIVFALPISYATLGVVSSVCSLLLSVIQIGGWGLFAAWFYRRHCARRIRRIQQETAGDSARLHRPAAQKGRSQQGGVLIALLVFYLLSTLLALFAVGCCDLFSLAGLLLTSAQSGTRGPRDMLSERHLIKRSCCNEDQKSRHSRRRARHNTRSSVATKAMPKEMLPIVDKPAIQYIVEEAVAAGIEDILIITGRNKEILEDHFDRNPELEAHLARSGKQKMLDECIEIANLANITYLRQKETKGLGHAISKARSFTGDEPFVVLYGDDVIMGQDPVAAQLIRAYETYGKACVGIKEVTREAIVKYSSLKVDPLRDNLYEGDRHDRRARAGQGVQSLLDPRPLPADPRDLRHPRQDRPRCGRRDPADRRDGGARAAGRHGGGRHLPACGMIWAPSWGSCRRRSRPRCATPKSARNSAPISRRSRRIYERIFGQNHRFCGKIMVFSLDFIPRYRV